MDKTELAHLRAICDAATQGGWHSPGLHEVHDHKHTIIADCSFWSDDDMHVTPEEAQRNADYIATFDPPTVRRLLDLIEEKQS